MFRGAVLSEVSGALSLINLSALIFFESEYFYLLVIAGQLFVTNKMADKNNILTGQR